VQHLPEQFTKHSVVVNGTRIAVAVGGTGKPVLLLHGWPQTADAWNKVMGPLAARGWKVIAPDLRGTGDSARATCYAKDDQAEDMRQLLERLDISTPVRLIGHDIGGMVAFSFARLHPERVARLVLIDLAIPGYGLEQAMDVAHGGKFHFGLFMTPDVPEMLLDGRERNFFKWFFDHLSKAPSNDESVDAATAAYRGRASLTAGFAHYRTLLADGQANRSWGYAGRILSMPVLAVGGEHNAGTRLADALKPVAMDLTPAVIAGSGHFVPEEQPKRLLAVLDSFLGDPAVPQG
jgi:pimeloyl-ACP methyl ester carboxylesterase